MLEGMYELSYESYFYCYVLVYKGLSSVKREPLPAFRPSPLLTNLV